MESQYFDQNYRIKYDFNLKSDQNFDTFIKDRMKDQLGLIENPTKKQIQEIIHRKVKRKLKGKTVSRFHRQNTG